MEGGLVEAFTPKDFSDGRQSHLPRNKNNSLKLLGALKSLQALFYLFFQSYFLPYLELIEAMLSDIEGAPKRFYKLMVSFDLFLVSFVLGIFAVERASFGRSVLCVVFI